MTTDAPRPLGALPFVLLAVVYLYPFPYFDKLRSANEVPRVLTTQQIVDRGVFHLDERLGDMTSIQDTSRAPNGHIYANKAPGPSFLAVPVYALCKLFGVTSLRATTWAFRVGAVTIPALLFLPFFYRLTRRFSAHEPARRTALLAYALGSPALAYGILFFSHQPAAVFAGGAFVAAVAVARRESPRPDRAAALAGFLAAGAVVMDYQSAIASAAIGVYLLIRAPRPVRSGTFALAGALPPAVGLGAYHAVCFGSPFKTGYSYALDPGPGQGVMGLIGPNLPAVKSTLILPSNGILVLVPWVVLAVVGAIVIASSREARAGAEAIVCAVIFVAYLVFLMCLNPYMSRGGWCVGPRYMTVALPFVGWLATAGFAAADRRRVTSVAAQALVVAAAVIYVVAATTYPHWPDKLANPLYELAFRLLWRGYAVHSLGTALGLHGLASLLPLYALALGLAIWLLARGPGRSLRTALLACVLGGLIVAGHRAFPLTGPYSDRAWGYITATWEPARPGTPPTGP